MVLKTLISVAYGLIMKSEVFFIKFVSTEQSTWFFYDIDLSLSECGHSVQVHNVIHAV